MASDCLHKDNPEMLERSRMRTEHIDQELTSFLSEIGERSSAQQGYQSYNQVPPPPPPPSQSSAAPWAQPQATDSMNAAYGYPNPWAMPPPPPPPPQQ